MATCLWWLWWSGGFRPGDRPGGSGSGAVLGIARPGGSERHGAYLGSAGLTRESYTILVTGFPAPKAAISKAGSLGEGGELSLYTFPRPAQPRLNPTFWSNDCRTPHPTNPGETLGSVIGRTGRPGRPGRGSGPRPRGGRRWS